MSDTLPETIWITPDLLTDPENVGIWTTQLEKDVEYIRADIHEATLRESKAESEFQIGLANDLKYHLANRTNENRALREALENLLEVVEYEDATAGCIRAATAALASQPVAQEADKAAEYADLLQQVSGCLAPVKTDEGTLVATAIAAGQRWQRANYALSELERIRTELVATKGMSDYANAISKARVLLQIPFAPLSNIYHCQPESAQEVSEPAGWRPIDTAPKDGTAIMVKLPDSNVPTIARWTDATGMAYSPCWVIIWDGEHLGKYDQPTHWMPLPEPPKP